MNPLPHDESPQHSENPTLLCRICNQPVLIETARTDSEGKAVHEDCYVHEINGQRRSWLSIATELSEEHDPTKFAELVKDLIEALDERADLKASTEESRDSER